MPSSAVRNEILWRIAEATGLVLAVIGLPLAGVVLAAKDPAPYLRFPPVYGQVGHAAFSWTAFIILALVSTFAVLPFVLRFFNYRYRPEHEPVPPRHFPWWGWLGVAGGLLAWLLAWTRFDGFSGFQRHTFVPLWFSYIVVINALTWRRVGACMLTDRPLKFLALFPLSAVFWWGFEFLNRFVENWRYEGHGAASTVEYLILGSLAFSTVLPAVLGMRELLTTYPRLTAPFRDFIPVPEVLSRRLALLSVGIASAALFTVGLVPNLTFPFLWLAPLMLVTGIRASRGGRTIVDTVAGGDWRPVITACLAALVCGFFWEMWNVPSMAKWTYCVPFVGRLEVFEMPLLGYLGYLPFGLECAVVAELFIPEPGVCRTPG